MDKFYIKILHIKWTASENEITFWKKWPSHLRVKCFWNAPQAPGPIFYLLLSIASADKRRRFFFFFTCRPCKLKFFDHYTNLGFCDMISFQLWRLIHITIGLSLTNIKNTEMVLWAFHYNKILTEFFKGNCIHTRPSNHSKFQQYIPKLWCLFLMDPERILNILVNCSQN